MAVVHYLESSTIGVIRMQIDWRGQRERRKSEIGERMERE